MSDSSTSRASRMPASRHGRHHRHRGRGSDAPGLGLGSVLTVVAMAAPLSAQLVMLVAMLAERRWMFAAMVAPGLIGCAASMALAAIPSLRRAADGTATGEAHASPRRAAGRVPAACMTDPSSAGREDGPDATGHSARPHDPARDFADGPCPPWETLSGIDPSRDRRCWQRIVRRWLEPPDTAALIGTAASEPFALDLVAQGPHALVAGTTGSGKSVLLQTWCMALACANPPDRLQFVFLDFKGGAAFSELERLPHTVGCVCDLDLAHARRALDALEHEITRRERLVAARHAADVRQLADPPARMVIMVDEFHALRDQLPDSVDRLVRVAALGRSLGMHLVACTQNPLGQVSADMKANIAVNVCLRVRDPMQSRELLGSPLAASISPAVPGAAYCHDGMDMTALRCAAARDLTALADAVVTAHRFCATSAPPPLFSAPLPRVAPRPGVGPVASRDAIPFAMGDTGVALREETIALSRGNIAIIGQRGRGKTTLLDLFAESIRVLPGIRLQRTRGSGQGTDARPDTRMGPVPHRDGTDPPPGPGLVWLVDDADPLLDPLCPDPLAATLREAMADPAVTVIIAVETSRHLRVPEHCAARIVFPTGERTTDMMNGIPAPLLDRMPPADADIPGRAVLIERGRATPVQCFLQIRG